ncbi:MAG: CinA family protein [Burkholderiaceae bacterium]|nr:CinA family protein [Burkholderiaceae bacterium]
MRRPGALGEIVAGRLRQAGHTVAVAESSTGGLVSASLLAVPGASAWFLGGSVVYTARSRREILGITAEDVAGLDPLTEAMAAKFAEVARRQLDATWGVAELGIAGPTGARYGHPPGISVIAVDGPVRRSATIETGSADREENMWRFTEAALALLDEAVIMSLKPA